MSFLRSVFSKITNKPQLPFSATPSCSVMNKKPPVVTQPDDPNYQRNMLLFLGFATGTYTCVGFYGFVECNDYLTTKVDVISTLQNPFSQNPFSKR